MARRRGRRPDDEEAALWNEVARSVRPLRKARPQSEAPPEPPPAAPPSEAASPPAGGPRPAPGSGRPRPAPASEPVTPLGPATPGLDRRTAERLRRGRTAPQARLDLHGLTLEAAHVALATFIRRTQSQGLRVVLVITGKGRPREQDGWISAPHGVLKDSVPRWLTLPPLADLVTGIFPAHPRHGGGGALYVYLRKAR
ncbi:MAG TPA: Smr/MutS family protein [Paracoccaceae bacterium]|nr:Smr/MutS family protein [Paracoccaceae bacterium]